MMAQLQEFKILFLGAANTGKTHLRQTLSRCEISGNCERLALGKERPINPRRRDRQVIQTGLVEMPRMSPRMASNYKRQDKQRQHRL